MTVLRSTLALVPRRGVFIGKSSHPVVKLVFQQSNKQLKTIQKQLCASAKDLASQLSKISVLVDEVHFQLLKDGERTRGNNSDVAEMLRDWKAISKVFYLNYVLFILTTNVVPLDSFTLRT